MILRIEDLKDVCSKILSAVDSSELSLLTETLELKAENRVLHLAVTNRTYYVEVKLPLDTDDDFHASVNANLFLKLISQITTDTVELSIANTHLVVKANGTYKFPLIYDGDGLLSLPKIIINNVTANFDIDNAILMSILTYNSKEISKGNFAHAVQSLYYVDENGAITFTTGACVNSFKLPSTIKILLSSNIVKLFKLFKGTSTHFELGYDTINGTTTQTKVSFRDDSVELTAILSCDDALLTSVPVSAIRGVASATYPYSVTVNRTSLLQKINRLLLFSNLKATLKPYGVFEFSESSVTIYDSKKENNETLYYIKDLESKCEYSLMLDLMDLKLTVETCSDEYINLFFGDGQAVIVKRANITNVIPEIRQI